MEQAKDKGSDNMNEVIFIKTYVDLTEQEFNDKNENELYDAVRGVWKISTNRAENINYAFTIHKGKIKKIYLIDEWHEANSTHYTTRTLNKNDQKMNGRIEFTGKTAIDMQHFIGKDVSNYYKKGEANPIKYMDLEFLNKELFSENISYPDDIEDKDEYSEGSKKRVTVNAYERNQVARQKCIEYYKAKCFICEFDFEKTYGEIGKGFIHVHHLKQLSEINEKYKVDPIKDLRPLCPNCHAIVHKRTPAYSIEEVKEFINKDL